MPFLGYRSLRMRQGVRNVVLQVVRFVVLLGMCFAGASVSRREASLPWRFEIFAGDRRERKQC